MADGQAPIVEVGAAMFGIASCRACRSTYDVKAVSVGMQDGPNGSRDVIHLCAAHRIVLGNALLASVAPC